MSQVDEKNFVRMPMAELTKPHEGRMCYLDRYWLVDKDNNALFFLNYAHPQCNSDRGVTEHLSRGKYWVEFVPVAYVPIDWSQY